MGNLYLATLILTFVILVIYGLVRTYQNDCQETPKALIKITSFNFTFTFSLISFSVLGGTISLYWLSQPLDVTHLAIGCFFSIALCYALHFDSYDKIGFILLLLSNIIFVLLCFYIESLVYDSSPDGKTYHQTAIYYLKNGWNPVKEKIFFRWCNEYPKASWIWGALAYKISGSIQSVKSINAIAIYSLFNLLLYFSLNLKIRIIGSFAFALVSILNPILITQFFTFYVDGLLYAFVISIMLLAALLLLDSTRDQRLKIFNLLLIIPIAANLKFTGVVFSYLILGIAGVFALIKKRKFPLLNLMKVTIISLVLSFGVVGYNPYVTNLTSGRHIFHPILGNKKVDIIVNNKPYYMRERNPFYNFATSMFSNVNNSWKKVRKPELRNPLRPEVFNEIKHIYLDTRINGFGPYFGLSFMISIIAIIYAMRKKWPLGQDKTTFLFIFLVIAFATIAIKEAWWARYVPHLWFLNALVLIVPVTSYSIKIARSLVIVLCLATSLPTIYYTINREYSNTLRINTFINNQKNRNNLVMFSQLKGHETSLKALLEDNDIPFSSTTPTEGKWKVEFVYHFRENKVIGVGRRIN